MNLGKIARIVWTDIAALLVVVVVESIALMVWHVPVALTVFQVVVVVLLILALPVAALKHDPKTLRRKHATDKQLVFEVASFGAFAATIAYAGYLLSFVFHSLNPTYIDTDHPQYLEATTVTLVTLVICQTLNLIFIRADARGRVFERHIWSNSKLLRAWGVSAFVALNVIYNPWLQPLLDTAGLDVIDWTIALLGGLFYTGLRVFQRYSRQHTRHAVLGLHRQAQHKPKV